jgi:hypothetical protein
VGVVRREEKGGRDVGRDVREEMPQEKKPCKVHAVTVFTGAPPTPSFCLDM